MREAAVGAGLPGFSAGLLAAAWGVGLVGCGLVSGNPLPGCEPRYSSIGLALVSLAVSLGSSAAVYGLSHRCRSPVGMLLALGGVVVLGAFGLFAFEECGRMPVEQTAGQLALAVGGLLGIAASRTALRQGACMHWAELRHVGGLASGRRPSR